MTMERRTECYAQPPSDYEVSCDVCGCSGTNITWSEFEHQIWCYRCEIDTKGTNGIFGGPIPLNACRLMGVSFDKVRISDGALLKMHVDDGAIIWRESITGKE